VIYLKLLFAVIFWGSSFTAGKVAVKYLPVYTVAFYRFFISSIFLVIVFRLYRCKFDIKKFIVCIFGGLTGIFAYNYFFLKGLSLTMASKASIIVAINPVLSVIGAVIIFKEKVNLKQSAGIFLAFIGIVVLITNGNINYIIGSKVNRGDIFILLAGISWSMFTLFGKKVLSSFSAVESTTYSVVWGTLLLTPFFIRENISGVIPLNLTSVISILVLSILATVLGFIWFYDGIKEIGASKAATFIYLVPVFGVTVGFFILDETLSLGSILGGLITISGVYMVNRFASK
jgi:drug/metabolite transporter (DMT)-like permease